MKDATSQKIKSNYPEIENIGKDIHALKTDVGQLATHVKEDNMNALSEIAQKEYKNLQNLKSKAEQYIKDKPSQSLAIAFAGGLLASLILGRR